MDLELYKENIIEHYKNPANKSKLEKVSFRELNPLCGDELSVYLLVEEGFVKDVKFDGQGCAISMAAMSMLTEKIKGLIVSEVAELGKEDILKMLGIPISHTRIKCATLSLKVVQGGLANVRN